MSNQGLQWVIRVGSEQVKGPYSTDAVIKMIAAGVFSGNEDIAKYPDGSWTPLAKQPEFYDALLESLENPIEVDVKKAQKMEAETVIRPIPHKPKQPAKVELPDAIKKIMEEEEKQQQAQNNDPTESTFAANKGKANLLLAKLNINPTTRAPRSRHSKNKVSTTPSRSDQFAIQMDDVEKLKTREQKKLLPLLIILLIVVGALFYFLNGSEEKKPQGWTLAAPVKPEEPISEEASLNFKRKLVKAFQVGKYEDILQAHRALALIIGSGSKDLESHGFLCVAYHFLWPFTNQTPEDFRSITVVTQAARGINPISSFSETCQVVFLLSKGQTKEAQSLLERTLDNQTTEKFTLTPFLYYMKGEMLEYEYNLLNAAAYFDQAAKLWTDWQMAKTSAGRAYLKLGKYSEAQNEFSSVLSQNIESKTALYGMGIVEFKGNKNKEKAHDYFSRAYAIRGTLNKEMHAESLFYFAQILEEKRELNKAKEVAQKGFQINPSHKGLKDLVVILGGDESLGNNQNEVVLLGDQFARAGDHLAAQAHYKSAFELNSKNASAAFKAAKSLWAINQTREAIRWLDKAIEANPNLIQAYVLKADYEAQKYNFTEAAKALAMANRKSPQNHEVLKGQALLEFRKNNISGTIQFGERAMKLYDADVELLSLLAQAYTKYYLNSPTLKPSDLEKKDQAMGSAMKYALRAIGLEPSLPDAQITYAKVLGAKDGPIRGEKYLKDLIKAFPYTLDYRIALAEYYRDVEKFNDAAETYLQVYQLDSKNKKAAFGLAECYRILNNFNEARKYYNITSVLDPSDVEPMFSNANLLIDTAYGREAKPNLQQAISKLEIVKSINSNFPRVSYLMAKAYMELGDFEKALSFIKEEKSKNPRIAEPYTLAAEVFFRKEQFKDCAAEYSMAIKLNPSSADLYVKASICYRKSDAVEIAQDMLDIARQKESGYTEIYREQGYIYEKMGLNAQARQEFEKYLELAPNAPDRAIIEDKVR